MASLTDFDVHVMFETKRDGRTEYLIPECFQGVAREVLQNVKPVLQDWLPPRKIRIAAFDIRIIHWDTVEAQAHGELGRWSPLEQAIRVDTTTSQVIVLDTLLHEINHAIFWAYGVEESDSEDRIVSMMATAWAQIYRDNPRLLTWISEIRYD